jgi:hypothetical protein
MVKIQTSIPKGEIETQEKLIHEGWRPMKEPRNLIVAILLSVPFMILNGILTGSLIHLFSPLSWEQFGFSSKGFSMTINLSFILFLFSLLIVHELIHLVLVPNFYQSEKTYIGITFFGGFVATEEEISKRRYILITIAPFVILSIFSSVVFGIFGLLTTTMKVLILFNAIASSVDMLSLVLILTQIPSNSLLKNNGPFTYWKKCEKKL